MQQRQAHRASIITAMVAAAILTFAGLAPAQAQSAERVVNGGTEVQATSLPVPNVHRYRAAQWLVDLLPEEARHGERRVRLWRRHGLLVHFLDELHSDRRAYHMAHRRLADAPVPQIPRVFPSFISTSRFT